MTSAPIALAFLTNEAGEDEGLGHAGIETYRDNPYVHVARECGQNSRDAAAAAELPVVMHFDLVRIPTSEYPVHAAQVDAVKQCLKKAKQKKDDKEIEFFERAKEVLEEDEIPMLKVEDRNTKGLVGPAVPGKPFHSLVKGTGVSNKESDTSGGSFGIGKNAAFAASEVQTVFYSTIYHDPETAKPRFLAQGKNILVSHRSTGGQERRATAYWGKPRFLPVEHENQVPAWLRRELVGTSVVIAAFRESPGWHYRIGASLLQNFFCGIHRGEIRFVLNNGEIDINRETLAQLLENKAINDAAEEADGGEEFRVARNLYECLISSDSIEQVLEIEGIGPVRLVMLMRDGLPKRVRIVRNGMSITDELSSFGDKLSSFPMYRDFVALVEPASHDGNKLLKRLENPRHDALSAERISDPKKRTEATRAMRNLAKAIRQAIKEQALQKPQERVDLNELSEYFDVPDVAETPPSPSTEDNPEILTYKPAPPRKQVSPVAPQQGTGTVGGRGRGRGGRGGGRGSGRGRGSGTGGAGYRGNGAVPLMEVRNVAVPASTGYSRRVFFTPMQTCQAMVEISAVGMDTPAALAISAADVGTIKNGKLVVDVESGARISFNVAFTVRYSGPIELLANRIEA